LKFAPLEIAVETVQSGDYTSVHFA